MQLALEHYMTLDGYAVAHGMMELEELPLKRLSSFVYWYFTRNAQDDQALQQFRSKLWMPPKGTAPDARSPWSAENESNAFASIKARLGTKPRQGT